MGIRVRPGVVWVPGARKTSGRFRGDGPTKALLHATITPCNVLPGYNNQAWAPHETMLWDRVRKVMKPRTHYYFDQYAKALQDEPGGVLTNNDWVFQWELAGYLGSGTPKGEFDILEAPDIYWEQLADKIGDIVISWNVQNKFSRSFDAGINEFNRAKRMSNAEWDSWHGFCTHADVPENHHWDSPLGAHVREVIRNKIWIPAPPVNKEEAEVPRIVQVSGKDPQYITNGTEVMWIKTQKEKDNVLRVWGTAVNKEPIPVPNLSGLGVLVGDKPPA